MDIDEILAKAELPEKTVTLCLRGSLVGRFEELEHKLRNASTAAMSLGAPAEATQIAREMEALRVEMTAHEVPFRIRALKPLNWRTFLNGQPEEGKTEQEQETHDARFHVWVCEMVARLCYEPAMSAAQADALSQSLSAGQWKQLTDACWEVNAERRNVPFSNLASALIGSSDPSLRQPEPGVSLTPAGSAKSRGKSPRMSTTKRGGSSGR